MDNIIACISFVIYSYIVAYIVNDAFENVRHNKERDEEEIIIIYNDEE